MDEAEKALEVRKQGYEITQDWKLDPDGCVYEYESSEGKTVVDGYGRPIRDEDYRTNNIRIDYIWDGGKLIEEIWEEDGYKSDTLYYYDEGRCVRTTSHYVFTRESINGEGTLEKSREYGDGFYNELTHFQDGTEITRYVMDKYGRFYREH
jgi:hypothetical protein